MSESRMLLHCGAREVTLDELKALPEPKPVGPCHFPIPFHRTLEITLGNLRDSGFEVTQQRLAVHRDTRFFASLDTRSALVPGTTLAIAIRASVDSSLSYAFVAGNRTFCCDNLCLSSDLSIFVRRKATKYGEGCFSSAMARVIRERLPQFAQNEAQRLRKFQETYVSMTEAESLILRSHEQGIISNRQLLPVLKQFREPAFEEFRAHGLSLWRLENAYTTCLADVAKRMPQRYAGISLSLQGLLLQAAGMRPEETDASMSA